MRPSVLFQKRSFHGSGEGLWSSLRLLLFLLHSRLQICLLCLTDSQHDLINLLLQNGPLALHTHGDLLKLRMPDNNGIVVAGSDPAAEFLAVLGFKILAGRNKDVRCRIVFFLFSVLLYLSLIRFRFSKVKKFENRKSRLSKIESHRSADSGHIYDFRKSKVWTFDLFRIYRQQSFSHK